MDRTDQTAIMESDAVELNQLKHKIYQEAIRDIGQSGYKPICVIYLVVQYLILQKHLL